MWSEQKVFVEPNRAEAAEKTDIECPAIIVLTRGATTQLTLSGAFSAEPGRYAHICRTDDRHGSLIQSNPSVPVAKIKAKRPFSG